MLTIKMRLQVLEQIKTEDEAGFLTMLDAGRGKVPNNDTPFTMEDGA